MGELLVCDRIIVLLTLGDATTRRMTEISGIKTTTLGAANQRNVHTGLVDKAGFVRREAIWRLTDEGRKWFSHLRDRNPTLVSWLLSTWRSRIEREYLA